jgi:diamine N-acetyltransferase
MAVVLQNVTRDNWRETLQLGVHPSQQRFVADYAPIAAIALAKAFVRPTGLVWVPYAIYADALLLGFIELAYAPESCDQYWIYHFFIDKAHQGKGYGKAALHALVQLVVEEHPEVQYIQLTVHPENNRAQQLYKGVGFRPTGEEVYDEPVYKLKI